MTTKRKPAGLAEQLRDAIEQSGLTQYRVAKTAGIAPVVLARFVSGERDLRLATAAKIAAALGLTLTKGK